VVLLVYSILYGFTATEARWLGFITSAAVIILGILFMTMVIHVLPSLLPSMQL
jgi:hypothetical protein